MSNPAKSYKCPSCGAALTFDGKLQKLHCSNCDTTVDIEAMDALEDSNSKEANPTWNVNSAGGEWSDSETGQTQHYRCPSCGAEVITDASTTASSCAYCGTPVVMADRFSSKKPDYILPFYISRDQAKDSMKNFYKGKIFLPKAFKDENLLEEIKGIYVPFWLYSCNANANFVYDATRVHHYSRGNYDITETEHFLVIRKGNADFEYVPVDGSAKMDDSYMDAIEPFDYSKLNQFSMDYLPGYLAENYDQDADTCSPRATARVRNAMSDLLSETCHYDTLTPRQSNLYTTENTVDYALLPVWTVTTRWKDKLYHFAVNGQSGKFIGDLPVSAGRFIGLTAGITAVLTVAIRFLFF